MPEDRLWCADGRVRRPRQPARTRRWARPPASAIRALSLGKPLVVSDVGWFARAAGRGRDQGAGRRARAGGARRRARAARGEPARRAEMAAAARRYAETEHELDRVADLYAARARGGGRRRRPCATRCSREVAARGRRGRDRGRLDPTRPSSASALREAALERRERVGARCGARARSPARPVLGLARRARRSSRPRSASQLARAAWSRPWIMVDELIYSRAREELRRDRPLPRPRPPDRHAFGFVYPVADQPRLAALPVDPARVRGGEGDQRAASCRWPQCRRTCSRGGSPASGSSLLAAALDARDPVAASTRPR